MRVCIIINPASGPARRGRGSQRVELARRTLERLGVDGDIRLTERGGHAHDLALEAAAAGTPVVVAWGGDGTVNEVGRALVQHRQSGEPAPDLGIVPGGSGNGLARELDIPFDPAAALDRAVRTRARTIDAGELGERLFFNVAGVGLDAHVAALVSTRVRHRGLLPYLSATLGDLIRYRPEDYTFEIDGRSEPRTALVVAFANSRQYGFGAQIAPAARLDDGLIDVICVEDRHALGNIVRLPSLFTGRLLQRTGVEAAQLREMTIRSRRAMLFHVDGEVVQGSDALPLRVRPGVLRVRA